MFVPILVAGGNPSAAIRQCGVSGLGFPGARLFLPLEGSGF